MRPAGGVLLAAAVAACSAPTSPAQLVAGIEPNPVSVVPVPIPCPPQQDCTSFPWGAGWTLIVVSRTAGRVLSADVEVVREGKVIAARAYGSDLIRQQGSDRVSAGGSLALSQGLQYPKPVSSHPPATVQVVVKAMPDSGGALEQVARAMAP